MHFNLGHLRQTHHWVVMKVTLLHLAIHDIDVAKSHASQTEGQATLNLTLNAQRVYRETTVHYADDAIHGEIAVLSNGHLDRLCHRGNIVNTRRDTPPASRRERLVPITFLSQHTQHPIHAGVVFCETQPQLQRINAPLVCQFIEKALVSDTRVGMPDRTPLLRHYP